MKSACINRTPQVHTELVDINRRTFSPMNFVPGGTIEWTGELIRILREKKKWYPC